MQQHRSSGSKERKGMSGGSSTACKADSAARK